jgi:hypothetical protein
VIPSGFKFKKVHLQNPICQFTRLGFQFINYTYSLHTLKYSLIEAFSSRIISLRHQLTIPPSAVLEMEWQNLPFGMEFSSDDFRALHFTTSSRGIR